MRFFMMGLIALLGLCPLAASALAINDYTIIIPDTVNSGPGIQDGASDPLDGRWVDFCQSTCFDGAISTWSLVNDNDSPYSISVTGGIDNLNDPSTDYENFFMYVGNADTYAASTIRWVLLPTTGVASNLTTPQVSSAVSLIIPANTTYYVVATYDSAKTADFVEVGLSDATPIPLPAALPLLAAGVGGLALAGRMRRRG